MMGIDQLLAARGIGIGKYRVGQKIHVPKLGIYNVAAMLKVDDCGNGVADVYDTVHKGGYVYRLESITGSGMFVKKYAESNLKSPIWSYAYSTAVGSGHIAVSDNGQVAVAGSGANANLIVLSSTGSVVRSLAVGTFTEVTSMAICNSGDVWFTAQQSGNSNINVCKNPNGTSTVTNIYGGTSNGYTSIVADEANACVYFGQVSSTSLFKCAMSVSAGAGNPTAFASVSSGYVRCILVSPYSSSIYLGTSVGWVYKINSTNGSITWSTQTITTANGWNQTGVAIGVVTTSSAMGLEQNETGLWLSDSGRGIGKISCADGSSQLTVATLPDYNSTSGYVVNSVIPILQADGTYNVYCSMSAVSQPIMSEWVKILP